ncbi:hypothetical protein EDD85DRAFT_819739 [Armillaria nabsnona]|nr:hypothetical protein EDD85DRAFT_819739 [Armillaria nabsnona]
MSVFSSMWLSVKLKALLEQVPLLDQCAALPVHSRLHRSLLWLGTGLPCAEVALMGSRGHNGAISTSSILVTRACIYELLLSPCVPRTNSVIHGKISHAIHETACQVSLYYWALGYQCLRIPKARTP